MPRGVGLRFLQTHMLAMSNPSNCALCQAGALFDSQAIDYIAQSKHWRVVWANPADHASYPCFVRVIWSAHAAEMSDLSGLEQTELMRVVMVVESAMRAVLKPDKINLASFGNYVPHVHWHIIPRWVDDMHWPEPNWAAPQRENGVGHGAAQRNALAAAIVAALEF